MKKYVMTPPPTELDQPEDTAPNFDLTDLATDTAVVSMIDIIHGEDLEDVVVTDVFDTENGVADGQGNSDVDPNAERAVGPPVSETGLIHEDSLLEEEDEEALVLEGFSEPQPSVSQVTKEPPAQESPENDGSAVEAALDSVGGKDTRIEQVNGQESAETITQEEIPIGEGATLRPRGRENTGHKGVLTVLVGPDQGQRFLLGDGTVLIGRAPECQVVLADAAASRRHCQIQASDGQYTLVDLGSENGTEVNGKTVTQFLLVPDAQLTVGNTVLHFGFLGDPEPSLALSLPERTIPSFNTRLEGKKQWIGLGVGILAVLLIILAASGVFTPGKRASRRALIVAPPAKVHKESVTKGATTPLSEEPAVDTEPAKKEVPEPKPEKSAVIPEPEPKAVNVAKSAPVKKQTTPRLAKVVTPKPRTVAKALTDQPGYAMYDRGEFDAAIAYFRQSGSDPGLKARAQKRARAIAGRIKRFKIQYKAGLNAFASGSPGSAGAHLKQAKKIDRQLTRAYQGRIRSKMAEVYEAQAAKAFASGQNGDAARYARAALAINPGAGRASSILKQLDGRINMLLAQAEVAKRSGRKADAKRILQDVLKILRRQDPRRGRAKMMMMGL
jgi:hypothetical protein